MRSGRMVLRASSALLVLLVCVSAARLVQAAVPDAGSPGVTAKRAAPSAGGGPTMAAAAVAPAGATLEARAAAGQETRVLVTYKESAVRTAAAAAAATVAMQARSGTLAPLGAAQVQQEALVRGFAVVKSATLAAGTAVERAGVRLQQDLSHLPMSVVSVSSTAALDALRADPNVASVAPVGTKKRALMQSLPLIKQPEAVSRSYGGAGCAVAVIDGGGDYWHSDLGSCTGVNAPASCRVVAMQDFSGTGFNGDPHATNVAATIAKLAPEAKIILLDVFGGDSTTDDIILAAINWVIQNAQAYKICSMNLSLGDGSYWTTHCNSSAYEVPFRTARSLGVIPAVATGNSYYGKAMSEPACAPSAVSVGAVHDSNHGAFDDCDTFTDADRVCCFSNIAPFMDMLAPGSSITAGGYTMSGTSMATPHVAGAAAVLRAAKPTASVADVIWAMKAGGKDVLDWYSGQTFPRLDVDGGVTKLLGLDSGTPPPPSPPPTVVDEEPPTALIRINNGATVTTSLNISVAVNGTDASGVKLMCVSDNATVPEECAPWVDYSTKPFFWKLQGDPSVDGDYTMRVWLEDTLGNRMALPASADIRYEIDNEPPVASLVMNGGANVTYNLTAILKIKANDTSGLSMYCITNDPTLSAAECTPFKTFPIAQLSVYDSAPITWKLADGDEGPRLVHVFVNDTRGNMMPVPAAAEVFYDVDYEPPVVSLFRINGGATSTTKALVSIEAKGADPSGVSQMCVSNNASYAEECTPWRTYSTNKFDWSLDVSGGDGVRTVRLFLSDSRNNKMLEPGLASIFLDVDDTPPNGTVLINNGAVDTATTAVQVYLTKVYDLAGLTGMTMCISRTPQCTTPFRPFAALSNFDLGDYTPGVKTVYVWLRDSLGNTMAQPITDTIIMLAGPNGTVSIESGAEFTGYRYPNARFTAPGRTEFCYTTSTTLDMRLCNVWRATPSVPIRIDIGGTQGVRTVRAIFRDAVRRTLVGVPTNTSITLDLTPPSDPPAMTLLGSTTISMAIGWNAASAADNASGVAGFKLVYRLGTVPPGTKCAAASGVFTVPLPLLPTVSSWNVTGLQPNRVYAFRLCTVDRVGNISPGIISPANAATAKPTAAPKANAVPKPSGQRGLRHAI